MVQRKRAQRLNGLFPLSYEGVVPVSPTNFVIDDRAPTPNDSKNFYIGDVWLNTGAAVPPSISDIYILVSLAGNIATWVSFGVGMMSTLTGNVGGPVPPDALSNFNIVGDTITTLVTGNPGTNTLTISTIDTAVVSTLTGNVGGPISPVGGTINIVTANSSPLFAGAGNTLTLDFGKTNLVLGDSLTHLGAAQQNVGLGFGVLHELTTGTDNVGIGFDTLLDMDVGTDNTAVGSRAMQFANSAMCINNSSVGSLSLSLLTTGNDNCAFGKSSLDALDTGTNNIAIGSSSGTNYTGAESFNILLDNAGTLGEDHTIRIGTTQTRNFQAGITGVAVSNAESVVIDSATGQLGVGGGNGNAGMNSFFMLIPSTALLFFPIGVNRYYFGTNAGALTVVFDPDSVVFPGNGVAVSANFTAPNDGRYFFGSAIQLEGVGQQITTLSMVLVINGDTANTYFQNINRTPAGGGIDVFSGNFTYYIPLTAGDVVEFAMVWSETVQGSFKNSILGPWTGKSNWIYGYRVS